MRAWSQITAIVPSSSSSSSSSRVGIVLVEESNVFPALVFFRGYIAQVARLSKTPDKG
jgi:hypothetical protein